MINYLIELNTYVNGFMFKQLYMYVYYKKIKFLFFYKNGFEIYKLKTLLINYCNQK